jgi:spoIIIJ-associated protein
MGTKAKGKVSFDKENNAIRVDIDTEDETGLLIGSRGETVNAIQTSLGMMLKNELNGWVRVLVNIGDWREKQEEQLKDLATQAAERARETGEPQTLYNLSPAQRRIVHMVLSEEKDLDTESFGEEEERYLVVKPKK